MDTQTFPALTPDHALTPQLTLFVLAVLLGCHALLRKTVHRRPLEPGTVAWYALPVATCIFLSAYTAQGMVHSGERSFCTSCDLVALAGFAVLARDWVLPALLGHADPEPDAKVRVGRVVAHVLVVAVALLGVAFLSVMAMEQPIQSSPLYNLLTVPFFVELGLVWLAGLLLYFVGQRHGGLVALVPVVLLGFGLTNYFMISFKGVVLVPGDLLALETAAEVAGGYTYEISDLCVRSLSYVCLAWACCSWMVGCTQRPLVPVAWIHRLGTRACRIGCSVLLALASAGALACAVSVPSYKDDFGVEVFAWMPQLSYVQYGSLTCFVTEIQDIPIPVPDGYSDEGAAELLASYVTDYDESIGSGEARRAAEAQYATQKPAVIYIMNETFADMSVYDGLRNGYTGPAFFNTGMGDSLSHGALALSVTGAGTCNTEFEALTGENMLFSGVGKYPYTLYNFSDVDNVARQLGEQGYDTTAIHPNNPNNWHRKAVYEQMGFDEFLTLSDFKGAPTFHNGVTDRATYDRILQILREDPDPQFVFDVTMQNHSGYNLGNTPEDQQLHYQTDGVTPFVNNCLNEYLSCINASDADLQYFVDQLSRLDRPVVLVFFGDHQPNIAASYNDAWYQGEDDLTHNERVYQTVYAVWANYDVAGADQSGAQVWTTPSYLNAQTLNAIGAPLTDFQKAQLVAAQTMPAANAFGLVGTDGTWYETDDASSPVFSTCQDLAELSYLEFATKIR